MGVIVDESKNMVVSVDYVPVLASSYSWATDKDNYLPQSKELASAALIDLDISVLSNAERMHTIPKGVVAEAKRGLEWRKEHGRGGTEVGVNTARTLAEGGQIGIRKIRHIAKYFPRHEVDKKGKGYKPGEDGYPSAGRIAWALWGGDAAQKWASAIVERENKKENSALIASHSYYEFETPLAVDLSDFETNAMKYMARVRQDGSGIDRLYAIKPCGSVLVWDDGCWDDLGNVDHDIDTYDKTLDDPYDSTEKIHVPIDSNTAITLAALFDADPFSPKSVDDINPEDREVYKKAMYEMDFSLVDAIVAAPEFKTDKDGNYTPAERSEKASGQLRDALGRFAVTGSRVIVGGNPQYKGEIIAQDAPSQTVRVRLDDGKEINVPANQTQQEDTWEGPEPGEQPESAEQPAEEGEAPEPVDTSGILGEPKESRVDKARLEKKITPLSKEALKTLLDNYPSWVEEQRKSSADGEPPQQSDNTEKSSDLWYEEPGYDWGGLKNAVGDKKIQEFLENPEETQNWYSEQISNPLTSAAEQQSPAQEKNYTNPRQSDVAPIYMAIVADDDPQAVLELIALIPKGPTSTAPMVYKRTPGQWEPAESILKDLNSPTPPAVIVLNNESLEDVIRQVDGPEIAAQKKLEKMEKEKEQTSAPAPVAAAARFSGGRNEKALKRYWTHGRGSSKINWGSSGDIARCVESLSLDLGDRAAAYCALLRKEAVGSWESSSRYGLVASAAPEMPSEDDVIDFVGQRARRRDAKDRITAGGDMHSKNLEGSKFYIPLVIPEDIESGDGRIFEKDSISLRELPLPLLWQIKTGDGHNGSVVVGKIIEMERTEHGIGNAHGVFDSGVYGQEAERLVRGGFIRGVSADLDKFEADEEAPDESSGETGEISSGRIKIKKARVMAVTLVPKPAFQECQIKLEDDEKQEDTVVPDGVYVDDVDAVEASALVACGIVAGVIPTTPPASWFENPALKEPTPLTVDDDGRVFGHIAAWHVDHIGMSFGTKPPRSRSKYAYFHTGVLRTEEGKDVPVGQLTLAGGHASLELSAQEAVRHYDDTASAIADVHAGEDAYGIWVAGALRPGTTPEQIRALRASAPSGDWRPIKGHLELVAVCQVNVPGFPIARARVASGQVMALVAAGANALAHMKSDPVAELKARIDNLERRPLELAANDARSRVLAIKAEELAAKVKKTKEEIEDEDISYLLRGMDDDTDAETLGMIAPEEMRRLIHENKALPDGKFPIRDWKELKKAIRAYGWVAPSDRNRVQKHIIMRAKALRREEMIPERWMRKRPTYKPFRRYSEEEEALFAAGNAIPADDFDDTDLEDNNAEFANENPCWEGYVMVGMKTVDGQEVPNCVPEDAAVDEYISQFAEISQEVRERLAGEGKAMPDGAYPIRNVSDLKNAIQAFGRAKESERTAVRKHIVKRARGLNREDLIPENWPEAPEKYKDEAGVYEVNENTEGADFPKAPRESEEEGLALPDGSYRIADERDLRRALWAYGQWPNKRSGKARAHIIKRAKAIGKEDMLPDIWPGAYNSSKEFQELSLRERAEIAASMVAAGGLDRNRGNAERLRRYWTRGPGAVKIRWGTPGDWRRCVRYLAKYMGPRAKGYCQLRHKEATGVYTGSRLNPGRRKGRNNSIFSAFTETEFGIFESLYGDPQKYMTEVTDLDMMLPIEEIMAEPDELYDASWPVPKPVIVLIEKCGYSPDGDGPTDDVDYVDFEDYELEDFESPYSGYDDDELD